MRPILQANHSWSRQTLFLPLLLFLAACGGGGEEGAPEPAVDFSGVEGSAPPVQSQLSEPAPLAVQPGDGDLDLNQEGADVFVPSAEILPAVAGSLPPEEYAPEPALQEPAPASRTSPGNCHSSYPDLCLPAEAGDLDCGDIPQKRFRVLASDPFRLDRDGDGIGCES